MRATSVAWPVATTSARPRPETTGVPDQTMELRSASGAEGATGCGLLSCGSDSPVSSASSQLRRRDCTTRASAGTMSPGVRNKRSPGTSASTGTLQLAVAAHARPSGVGAIERGQERLAAPLQPVADAGVGAEHRADGAEIHQLAQQRREGSGAGQKAALQIGELIGEQPPARAHAGSHAVGAIAAQAALGFAAVEPVLVHRQAAARLPSAGRACIEPMGSIGYADCCQSHRGRKILRKRVGGFLRERPGTSLAIVAGAAALGGAEWAAGALIGGALISLLAPRSGAEMRERLKQRFRDFIHRDQQTA